MHGDVDAVVVGVGSGGTLTGLGRFFARASPKTAMVLADPVGSILAPLALRGERVKAGSWVVEGIGEDFVPKNCDLSFVKAAYEISDTESIAAARLLLAQRRHPRRIVLRNPARRRPALLPRADGAQAGGDAWSATPAPATCRRSTTTAGSSSRGWPSARCTATCAT